MSKNPSPKQTAARLVHEIRERLEQPKQKFSVLDWRAEAVKACKDILEGLGEIAVIALVDKEDRESRPGRSKPWDEPQQKELFPLDGLYALENYDRIAVRHAQRDHMEIVLRMHDKNLEAVRLATEKLHEEFDLLKPYWGPGVTKEEAVRRYYEDHPDDLLPKAGD